MYTTYFGLSENPFNMTPDHKYLFLSHHHNEALDHLLYGIHERKGFIAVWGGIGTGKTTLCRALLNQLEPSTRTALVFNTSISDIELLEAINQEFGVLPTGDKTSKKAQIDRLNAFLLENHKKNGNAVVIVDEAQNLSAEALEQLRMLSNLETDKEKLLQIVLVGQPELVKLLRSPFLAQLNERITIRYQLQPLDRSEVQSYLEHRLIVAGSRGTVRFTKGAVRAIHGYSQGNPRRINAVCDRALLVAYCKDEFAVSKDSILRAADDIRGDFNGKRPYFRPAWIQNGLAPAAAVMVMAFIVVNLTGWNFKEGALSFFSAAEKITTVQAKALLPNPDSLEPPSTATAEKRPFIRKAIQNRPPAPALAMDDRTSLATLFRLFDVLKAEKDLAAGDVYPGLFTFEGDPGLYRRFLRPFRIRIKSDGKDGPGYILIKEVTVGGAVALDADGNQRALTEDYILSHWDGEISWIYPYEPVSGRLTEGMSGLAVLRIQQTLHELGYAVEPRGVYDGPTFGEVMRFQLNHGLRADGAVDTSTKALLYQMTG
jgi:general secretion pathway protein A